MFSDTDYNDWWEDLTIEQKRAAFELWQKSDVKSIFLKYETDNTTHSNIPLPNVNVANVVDYEEARKQLASKVVWDQDRFPRPLAWDEDRFKDISIGGHLMTDAEFQAWLREQGQRDTSKRYG